MKIIIKLRGLVITVQQERSTTDIKNKKHFCTDKKTFQEIK